MTNSPFVRTSHELECYKLKQTNSSAVSDVVTKKHLHHRNPVYIHKLHLWNNEMKTKTDCVKMDYTYNINSETQFIRFFSQAFYFLVKKVAVKTRFILLPCIVLMHSKPWKSQSLIVMSAEQDASSLPVWSKEMSCTESVWPFSVRSKSPVS